MYNAACSRLARSSSLGTVDLRLRTPDCVDDEADPIALAGRQAPAGDLAAKLAVALPFDLPGMKTNRNSSASMSSCGRPVEAYQRVWILMVSPRRVDILTPRTFADT